MKDNNKNRECSKRYYRKHKKELKIKQKIYRDAHKEEKKKWVELNREHWLAYRRQHRKANIEHYRAKDKEYNKKAKDYHKAYRQSHRKEFNLYRKNKRDSEINYRIIENLRGRMRAVLHGKNKSDITLKILGCSGQGLKNHLEKQFVEGMTWENYGFDGWHIDHIKPCCTFDLTQESEQLKCFNFKNLRPLWAYDNLSKGGG